MASSEVLKHRAAELLLELDDTLAQLARAGLAESSTETIDLANLLTVDVNRMARRLPDQIDAHV